MRTHFEYQQRNSKIFESLEMEIVTFRSSTPEAIVVSPTNLTRTEEDEQNNEENVAAIVSRLSGN